MTALLDAAVRVREMSPAEVQRLTSFRFTDPNPQENRSFAGSTFRELPEFVQDVVEERLGLRPHEWNALVRDGAAVEVTGGGRYGISTALRSVRRRLTWNGKPRSERVCPDCDGGCVDVDPDGSVTGVVGTPYVCGCMGML